MKKNWALALIGAALLVAGCATPSAPVATAAAPVTLRLIAFNDYHGNLEAVPGLTLSWPDPAQPGKTARLNTGGAAYLAGTVAALRAGAERSVVISSGDLIGATPLVSALFRHESTIDIANRIGVDVGIPGNHEFDAGREELLRVLAGGCLANATDSITVSCALDQFAGARFPLIAANVLRADGSTLFAPSMVRDVGGVKVGFIGAVTQVTPSIVVPSGIVGLRFVDEADAINAEAARLKSRGVKALVAIIHEGGEIGSPGQPASWNDPACPGARGAIFDIARRLTPDVAVVFSAHTHQGYACVIDGRPVMQATALGRGVSVVDLVLDPRSGEVDRARSAQRNLPVFNDRTEARLRQAIIAAEPAPYAAVLLAARPVAEVADRVAAYSAAAAPRAQKPVGRIAGNFDRAGSTDTAIGRLVADAQWRATQAGDRGGAQFALMNPGGVRSDLRCPGKPPCTITYGEAFTSQPFGNSLVVMTLNGAQIKQLLEDQQPAGRATPLFLTPSAALTYRWSPLASPGQHVLDLKLNGQAIDPAADYRFTVNSFLAEGGDGYTPLKSGRQRLGGGLDIDALVAQLARDPAPDPAARIVLAP